MAVATHDHEVSGDIRAMGKDRVRNIDALGSDALDLDIESMARKIVSECTAPVSRADWLLAIFLRQAESVMLRINPMANRPTISRLIVRISPRFAPGLDKTCHAPR